MALIQSTPVVRSGGNFTATATFPTPVTAGNTIIVICANYIGGYAVVAGDVVGTLTAAAQEVRSSSTNWLQILYKPVVTGGTETLRFSGGNYIAATCHEFSGINVSNPKDASGTVSNAATVTATTANVAPGAIVFTGFVANQDTTAVGFTTPTGYTLLDITGNSAIDTAYIAAWKTCVGPETSSATTTSSIPTTAVDGVIATFNPTDPTVVSEGRNAGTLATTTVSTLSWANPANAQTLNGASATHTTTTTAANMPFLNLSNFGFNIPTTSTVLGITARITRAATGGSVGTIRDNTVQLTKTAGSRVGTNLGATATDWPTSLAAATYGGEANLWGTTWLPSQINATGFGISVRVVGVTTGANRVANIDHILLTVTYRIAATGTVKSVTFSYSSTGDYALAGVRERLVIRPDSQSQTNTTNADRSRSGAFAINETASSTIVVDRSRVISQLIAEVQTNAVALRRSRNVYTSIAELQALTFNAIKIKGISLSIAETQTVVFAVRRALRVQYNVAESQSNVVAVRANRRVATSINETEAVSSIALRRNRGVSTSIAESETINVAITRLKQAAFAIVEASSITLSAQKVKLLALSIAETEGFSFGTLRRTRQIAEVINEATTVSLATLLRSRKHSFSVAETEALSFAYKRLRAASVAIAELEAVAFTPARKRELSTTISQLETVAFAVLKVKMVGYTVSQTSNDAFWVARSRFVNPAITEFEAFQAKLNRARRLVTQINETSNHTLNVKRLRSQVVSINETQGTDVALTRLRGLAVDIEEMTGITIDIKAMHSTDVDNISVTMTWQEWEFVSETNRNSTIQLINKTETFMLINTTSSDIMIKSGSASDVNFVSNGQFIIGPINP